MIEVNEIPFGHIKKEPVTGSYNGMRYMVLHENKESESIQAWVWPEPYSFENTEEAIKTCDTFSFDEAGYMECIEWLNGQYDSKRELWNMVFQKPLLEIM